ncbi:kinase-like domain-containing protein [Thelephora terrestris]|uniref:Kinase-like domain-containing protein n=1 Tax=Thelephora terrestris TaxID=56493 RepID=A0A9P6HGV6_9AGAM|nr:kinase-like domain-containing protein [Thelephora terrestris]
MSKDYQQLWRDVTSASDEARAVRVLAEILADKEGRTFISTLEGEDAELCIEILDRGIVKHKLKIAEKQYFFTTLRRLAACHERLPESMTIAENDVKVQAGILASGGFADVRRGRYKGHFVAVKTLRVAMVDDVSKIRRRFCREVVLWSTLSHPNVLKLEGVHGGMGEGQFSTISEWMNQGNIMQYIERNDVNRLELLQGAAEGLEYLHGAHLIHGDLKGANILMSNDTPPRACLADFGFMTMVLDPDHPMSCSEDLGGGTLMFMSPELLMSERGKTRLTPQSDVYAFGLVIFQVLTGEAPFPGLFGSVVPVLTGVRPKKPDNAPSIGLSDHLWAFVEKCWGGDVGLRPDVKEVVTRLRQTNTEWEGVMPHSIKDKKDVTTLSQDEKSDLSRAPGLFGEFVDVTLGDATDSQVGGSFSLLSMPSTQGTVPPQGLQGIAPRIEPRDDSMKFAGSFGESPDVALGDAIGPQVDGSFNHSSIPAPQGTGPPQDLQGTAPGDQPCDDLMKCPGNLGESPDVAFGDATDSQVGGSFNHSSIRFTEETGLPRDLDDTAPGVNPLDPTRPIDELHYLHLDQTHKPPRSSLPKKKQTSFKSLKQRFRRIFGLRPRGTAPKPD